MPGLPDIAFDDNGLAPCVAQDHRSGAVLTLAWVNAESLAKTVETGNLWFYSRSRGELWHKGETSGNYLRVCDLRYDCDADAGMSTRIRAKRIRRFANAISRRLRASDYRGITVFQMWSTKEGYASNPWYIYPRKKTDKANTIWEVEWYE